MAHFKSTIITGGSLAQYAKLIKTEAKKLKLAGNPMYIDLYSQAEAVLNLSQRVDSASL